MSEPKTRKRRKDARPQEILAAALEVFAEKGLSAAKVEDIAVRAGIAKGTIYLYFKTKEDVFEAMVRTHIAPVFSRLDGLTSESDGSSAELLTAVIKNLYDGLILSKDRRTIMKLLIAEGTQFPHLVEFYYREILSGADRMLHKIMQRGVASGEFLPSAVLREPKVILGPAVMAAVWYMTFEHVAPLDHNLFLQAHLDLVFQGLLARNPRVDPAGFSPSPQARSASE